jgi:uncharacterized membrane protein
MDRSTIRHMVLEQKGGYLLLPVLIMFGLSLIALILPHLEANTVLSNAAMHIPWLVPKDPAMSQLLLGAVAGSCITIVSVVYSVLLIALTFASIQFSPRILNLFWRDHVSQTTLGLFIGTFAYCLILLPSVHGKSVPVLSLSFALVLATLCLFFLIYFIHHIALAIQVNYIVDRICRETESVMRHIFGAKLKGFPKAEESVEEPSDRIVIPSAKTGYVQFVDEDTLTEIAIKHNLSIYLYRGTGQFVPAGVPGLSISPHTADSAEIRRQCLRCMHIGPLRSMENDVEFGFLQIVDIALKAISPAVNDPSTAISCIDHLSSLLVVAATLEPPPNRIYDEQGVVRLSRRQTSFVRLLEIAYNQITPYAKGDMAVSLRLMRALHDISGVTNYPPYLSALRKQAQLITKTCSANFSEEETEELTQRLSIIEKRSRDVS